MGNSNPLPFPKIKQLLATPYLFDAISVGYAGQNPSPSAYSIQARYKSADHPQYPLHILWAGFSLITMDGDVLNIWRDAGLKPYGFTGFGAVALRCKPLESAAEFTVEDEEALSKWAAEALPALLNLTEVENACISIDPEVSCTDDGVMFHFSFSVPTDDIEWERCVRMTQIAQEGTYATTQSIIRKSLEAEQKADHKGKLH